jgi:hypothetical protein
MKPLCIHIALAVLVFLSPLWGTGGNLFAQTGTISGKLKQNDGEPAIGAKIFVYTTNGEEIVGDANTADDNDNMGKFKTTPIPIGMFTVHIKYEGHKRVMVTSVPVEAGKSTEINITLEPIEPHEAEEVNIAYSTLVPKAIPPAKQEEPKKK